MRGHAIQGDLYRVLSRRSVNPLNPEANVMVKGPEVPPEGHHKSRRLINHWANPPLTNHHCHLLEEAAGTLGFEIHLQSAPLLNVRLNKLGIRVLRRRVLGLVRVLGHLATPLDEGAALGIPVLVHLRAAVVLGQVAGVHALHQHRLPLLDVRLEDLNLAQRVLVQELLHDVEGKRKHLGS